MWRMGKYTLPHVHIKDETGARKLQKPVGRYITLETPYLAKEGRVVPPGDHLGSSWGGAETFDSGYKH